MVCVPGASEDVLKAALPLASSGTVPKVVAPSLKVTLPVGVRWPELGVTVALKVTVCPNVDGLALEASAVIDEFWLTINAKLCVALGDTPFCAVNVTLNVPVAVGIPLSVPVPSPLSVNVTPDGKAPDSVMLGVGLPIVITVNELCVPTVKFALLLLVMAGACPLVTANVVEPQIDPAQALIVAVPAPTP
jgi:hypothetical protein